MILVKLGGSIITNKGKPLSPRKKIIGAIAKSLRKINEPMILVHGGGSYGHYWSVKYDMHTKPEKYEHRGVSVVKNSMVELNMIVLNMLLENKINTYCLSPASFMQGDRPVTRKIKEVGDIAGTGLVPVTFGDALWYGQKKTYILSGDKIMTHMARVLRPRLCIFALNEDGVYNDMDSMKLIREFRDERPSVIESMADVTGGMTRKIEEASKISRLGIDVFFVNGNRSERITKAVKRDIFDGTVFRGK